VVLQVPPPAISIERNSCPVCCVGFAWETPRTVERPDLNSEPVTSLSHGIIRVRDSVIGECVPHRGFGLPALQHVAVIGVSRFDACEPVIMLLPRTVHSARVPRFTSPLKLSVR
jgi:hypothetical protein